MTDTSSPLTLATSEAGLPLPRLTRKAHEILKCIKKIPKAAAAQEELHVRKKKFLLLFTSPTGQYITFAILCFAALVFDFIISSRTLDWLAAIVDIQVEFLAALFTLIDASIATLASGAFAHNLIEKGTLRHRWRPFLWGLGLIKILMFIIFIFFVYADINSYGWIETLLQIGLIALVYAALDFAGEGLSYSIGSAWWMFMENVWFENPNTIRNKATGLLHKFDKTAHEFGISASAARAFYKLPADEVH